MVQSLWRRNWNRLVVAEVEVEDEEEEEEVGEEAIKQDRVHAGKQNVSSKLSRRTLQTSSA